jgi:hypothetical protein
MITDCLVSHKGKPVVEISKLVTVCDAYFWFSFPFGQIILAKSPLPFSGG